MTDITLKEMKEKLADRNWRVSNLYYIKDIKGDKILFKPNQVQQYLMDHMWFFNIIPKARQLGITTFFTIFYLDQVLFGANKTATIIAHTEKDMKKIFRNKVKFAWDNIHPWVKTYIGEPDTNTANELSFPNGSIISVALSSRSDTVQFLHISEFGKICAKYPEKAEEIVTGAINSVHAGGMVSIESTAEGREGYFYEFSMDAEKRKKEGVELTPLDFKIFFFPWWIDTRYFLEATFAIPREMKDYFKSLEKKHNIILTEAQQRWYIKKEALNKGKMYQEYPSTLQEAFMASLEGAYYAQEMNRVYTQKRIAPLPVVDNVEVDTWWDLGMNDMNVIVFTQTVGPIIRIIDVYNNRGYGLSHYVDKLKEKGYRYGQHILPHDVEVRDLSTGLSRKSTLFNLGMTNIRVSPKPQRVQDGIEKVRGLFDRFYFDEERTKPLYEALANYRKEFDPKMGTFKDYPRHDNNSHFCFSGDTIIKTKRGNRKISEIKSGDKVASPFGWTTVTWSGVTSIQVTGDYLGVEMTSNHPVLTSRGFVDVDTMRNGDMILVCKKEKDQLEKMLFTRGLSLGGTQNQTGVSVVFISNLLNRVKQVILRKGYIGLYGKPKKGKYLTDILFTIKMVTLLIINYPTWNVCRVESISQTTCSNPPESNKAEKVSKSHEYMPQGGMGLRMVSNFTGFLVRYLGKKDRNILINVFTVKKNTKHTSPKGQSTVHLFARGGTQGEEKDVYNLKTESGVFYVNGFVVSNSDAVRNGCAMWTEEMKFEDKHQQEAYERKTDQSFFG